MKLLKTIDENILKWLLAIFLFFIPLYMKFPLQNVTFTYISIRLDDLLVSALIGIFLLQVVRRKISFSALPFKKHVAIFWVILFVSLASGLWLTHTIDYATIGFLHTLRRVQYMILFFIAYSTIKSSHDFKFFMQIFLISLLLVGVYALGQRIFGFPAISTMNPEFAKGRVLYLTPEARLSSTFAGHYDLGAYLVFLFPLMSALYFWKQEYVLSLQEKIFLLAASVLPIIINVFTLAYVVYGLTALDLVQIVITTRLFLLILCSTATAAAIYLASQGRVQKYMIFIVITLSIIILIGTASRTSSIAYLVSLTGYLLYFRRIRYLAFVLVFSLALTTLDTDLVQRWAKTIQIKQIIINQKTGEQVVVQRIRSDELPAGTAFVKKGSTSDTIASALLKQELINKATMSGMATGAADYQTYSAVAGDISISTRLQVSWPRALKAFLRNPLVGTGPSSITESTDGDFLRWLGETGALGFGAFLWIIGSIIKLLYDKSRHSRIEVQMVVYAVIFGCAGLMINAILIDVFEASKVAYTFWATLGMLAAFVHFNSKGLNSAPDI